MPDSTEKLDAARKLVDSCDGRYERARKLIGTYCRHEMTGTVYRIVGLHHHEGFTLFGLHDDPHMGIGCGRYVRWSMQENGHEPGGTIPISRAEYLAVAGPLFPELGRMAGVTAECERKE